MKYNKTKWDEKTKNDENIGVGQKVLYRLYNFANESRALAAKYHVDAYTVLRRTGANYLIRANGAENDKSDRIVNRDQIRPYVEATDPDEASKRTRKAAETARRRLGMLAAASGNDTVDIE